MFDSIKNSAQKAKDSAISYTVKELANSESFSELGKVIDLQLNSKEKTAQIDILLKGEPESIHVTIGKYLISGTEADGELLLCDIVTTREWMNAVINKVFQGKYSLKLNGNVFTILNKTL